MKNMIRNFYLDIQPYISVDIIAGAAATLAIFYVTVVLLFGLS